MRQKSCLVSTLVVVLRDWCCVERRQQWPINHDKSFISPGRHLSCFLSDLQFKQMEKHEGRIEQCVRTEQPLTYSQQGLGNLRL